MLGLYHETLNVEEQAIVNEIRECWVETRKTLPCTNLNFNVKFSPSGKAHIEIMVYNVHSYYTLPDALGVFRRLAGKEV